MSLTMLQPLLAQGAIPPLAPSTAAAAAAVANSSAPAAAQPGVATQAPAAVACTCAAPRSPGMKYAHYAPQGLMQLVKAKPPGRRLYPSGRPHGAVARRADRRARLCRAYGIVRREPCPCRRQVSRSWKRLRMDYMLHCVSSMNSACSVSGRKRAPKKASGTP